MTDQAPTVDGNGAAGNQPAVSNQPIEGEAERTQKLVDARLSEALKPVLAEIRGVQSRQDKDRKGFQEILDEYKKYKAKGLSDEEAESAMLEGRKASEKDALLFKIAEKLGISDSPASQPAGNGGGGTDATAQVITSLGLNSNDAGVLKIVAENADPIQRAAKLGEYKATLGQQKPEPANAPSLQTGPAKASPDLEKQYKERLAQIAQTVRGDARLRQIASLKAEFQQKGLEVN